MSIRRIAALTRCLAACAALSLCLMAAGCAATVNKAGGTPAPDAVVLTMLNPGGAIELQPFLAAVERLSGGALRIDLQNQWHAGQLTAEADVVHEVQSGTAALGLAPVRTWNGVGVRSFDALIAPFAVDSLALEQSVLDSDLVQTMLRGTAAIGLTGVGVLPGPMRKPVGITHELVGPADYHGRTLAISASVVAARTFSALRASTVPFLFNGRPIDAFDGIEMQVGSVEGNRYDQVAGTITSNVNLWPRPLVVFANEESFAALSGQQQQVLRAAVKGAVAGTIELDRETESVGNLCRRGAIRFVTASPKQLQELREATAPVWAWLRSDQQTRQALDRIESLRTAVSAAGAAEAPPSCPEASSPDQLSSPDQPGAQPTGGRTALDGVYEMTNPQVDRVAAGVAPGDNAPENYGEWVFVIDRGLFAFTQENGPACTWGYGSWVVKGHDVQWRFTDGGGVAPSGAANKPGEYFVYGWSLYHDTLTLTPVPGEISPENFLAKPWHRVSRTPSRDRLSSRCAPPAAALPAS